MAILGTLLGDIILWVRRIIKSSSNQEITDATIQDYVNRFYIYDLPQRIQLFELKRQYTFETQANIFEYQFPYNNYQGVEPPVYCDGLQIGFFESNDQFYKIFPELVLNEQPLQGDGTTGPYQVQFNRLPILRGFTDDLGNLLPYVYITAVDAGGIQMYIVDDGFGNLIQTDGTFQNGPAGPGNPPIPAGTVDYIGGLANFSYNTLVPSGNIITTQTSPYSSGYPRVLLFFNNILKLYPVPDRPYKVQLDTYITPAQFLNSSSAVPFSYMSEYLARGAAQKILSDNADYDQYQFYEPLFRAQENQVLRRTSRTRALIRTPTIFSGQMGANPYLYTQY